MNRFVPFLVVGLALTGMLTSSAMGGDLVVFQTSNVVANAQISDTPSVVAPSVTTTDLSLNFPFVQPLGNAWGNALSAGNMNKFGGDNLTLATAINGEGILDAGATDGGDYITVTVTPNQPIDFTDLSMNISHNNIDGAAWTSPNIDLLTSLTGFNAASSLGTWNPPDPAAFSTASHTFSLAALPLGVNVPVEFRVYFSNVSNRMSIGFAFNGADSVPPDFVIRGTPVPEPGTILLLGMGAIACIATRRFRM